MMEWFVRFLCEHLNKKITPPLQINVFKSSIEETLYCTACLGKATAIYFHDGLVPENFSQRNLEV